MFFQVLENTNVCESERTSSLQHEPEFAACSG
jgi:hypothetical protein